MTIQMRHPPTGAGLYARDVAELLSLRKQIEDRIERDIALLDALDGDPDLEPDDDAEGAHSYHFPGIGYFCYDPDREPDVTPVTLDGVADRETAAAYWEQRRKRSAARARAAKAARRRRAA